MVEGRWVAVVEGRWVAVVEGRWVAVVEGGVSEGVVGWATGGNGCV